MVLIPDELQADVYAKDIAPNLKQGAYLAFCSRLQHSLR